MIRIANLTVPLNYDMELLKNIAARKLRILTSRIKNIAIDKRSVDTVNKQDICFKMTVLIDVAGEETEIVYSIKDKCIRVAPKVPAYPIPSNIKLPLRPIVVGCGPAGIFAALVLAEAGARPILLERGLDVDRRKHRVSEFWHTGILDTSSNVQFGEGGAGAFSDGKLKIGSKDCRKIKVLQEFIEAGAPPEIMYLEKPHIGTDKLSEAVKGLRKKMISHGGEVHFGATVTDILRKDGKVSGIGFIEEGQYKELPCHHVVLAIGHSARDTFARLLSDGIQIEQKPFSIGVRIEHPQYLIDQIKYGDYAGHLALGAADYKMVVHLKSGRNVYTFCMCPGGKVVAATSEENCLLTNGMSEYARDGRNANTALLVTVGKENLKSAHPLAGVDYQRGIEEAAFAAGGGGYYAPVQRLEDFLNRRGTHSFGEVKPTYMPGTRFAPVDSYLPEYIADSLRQAVKEMDDWMPGFYYPDAILTGAETRSSSPVRMIRGDSLEAVGVKGLYPCGEGAGYAGGIISAAVDGIKCAERILGLSENLF